MVVSPLVCLVAHRIRPSRGRSQLLPCAKEQTDRLARFPTGRRSGFRRQSETPVLRACRTAAICDTRETKLTGDRIAMTLPATMTAIEITGPGGPEVLQPVSVPVPTPTAGEILIKVAYAGVNRPDALQRAGAYNPPAGASPLPGLEAAGTVAAVGPGVSRWRAGDEVCALLPGGGYAEYVVTPAAHALPVPKGMELREAACLPETFFTVWSNVFQRGGLKAGER